MKPLDPGELDQRLYLQSPVYTKSASGENQITDWTPVTMLWGKVEEIPPSSNAEAFIAARDHSEISYIVTIRRYSGIRPDMRFLWGSTPLDIRAVPPELGRSDRVKITCRVKR